MGRLENKIALVTGGSMGQGAAEAKLFMEEGAKVIIGDIADEKGKAYAEELGENVSYIHLDVSKEDDWKSAYEYVKDNFGRLDILINNAGIGGDRGTVENVTMDGFNETLAVDLNGPLMGIETMVPLMKDNGGAIVNIGSDAGLSGMSAPAYCSAKWGLRGLTKSAAQTLAKYNIRVNAIHPGMIKTPLSDTAREGTLDAFMQQVPLNRVADPREIATVALFLASDDSSYVTAVDLPVDGGFNEAGVYNPSSKV